MGNDSFDDNSDMMDVKDKIRALEKRKKFFELWHDVHPEICEIQLGHINLRLNELKDAR